MYRTVPTALKYCTLLCCTTLLPGINHQMLFSSCWSIVVAFPSHASTTVNYVLYLSLPRVHIKRVNSILCYLPTSPPLPVLHRKLGCGGFSSTTGFVLGWWAPVLADRCCHLSFSGPNRVIVVAVICVARFFHKGFTWQLFTYLTHEFLACLVLACLVPS